MAKLDRSGSARDESEMLGCPRGPAAPGDERDRWIAAGRAVFRPGATCPLVNLGFRDTARNPARAS